MSSPTLSTVSARETFNAELRWTFAKTFVEPVLPKASNDESALELLPNHEFLIRSAAPAIAIVKSRKVAHSWAIACKCYCRAATEPQSTSIIASYDEEEAREKLNFLKWIHKAVCDKNPAFLRELKMTEGTEVREMANGSRIRFIARKAPTGPGASIELDEFSVEPPGRVTAAEILVGALGCTTHTGQVSVGGTQRGPDTMFNQIVSGKLEEQMRNDPIFAGQAIRTWLVGEFPWWTSPALCNNPREAMFKAPSMDTADRVMKYGNDKLIGQFQLYYSTPDLGLEMFQREFECKILDDRLSYFEYALIQSCYDLAPKDYWFRSCEADGQNKPYGGDSLEKAKIIINSLASMIKSDASFRGEYGITIDIGRDRDHDEIWICQVPKWDKEMLIPRINIGMEDMRFEGKEVILHHAYTKLPITRGYIDATRGSMGVQLQERMEKRYHQRAMPFEFTNASKQIIATGMKGRMQNQKLILPRKRDDFKKLEAQLLRVKKLLTPSKNVVFDVARTSDGHGDSFWSLAMMCDLFAQAKKWIPMRGAAMQQRR